uniref:Structural maintenance of chromosomes protein 6 n=1 Tax=Mastacembelus armatus TaxID=205130 RepID=A0A7N8XDP7_9TELE
MSKRKGSVITNAVAVKTSRVTVVDAKDATEDKNNQGPSFKHFPKTAQPATGDIGIIESITLKNFMCHHLLGPFQFGPNVNFIVGNNGSGKSAILTALIVGLGGKATVTNRGISLKDFVKTNENAADITIKLRNRGPDAYKMDVYGNTISIEHRLSSDGSRTYKLKSKSGNLISNKKEELTTILDHFNIQLDNPVSILSQEMSKQFLHSKSDTDKYKFFMKATLLEQMKRDYIYIKHTKTVTRQQVQRHEECLKDLKQEFLQRKERYENVSSFTEMKSVLENLKKTMAWCLVRISLSDRKKNITVCSKGVLGSETEKKQAKSNQLDRIREEQESLTEESLKLKEQDKVTGSIILNSDGETEYAKRQKTLCGLREQLEELENKCTQLNDEVKNKHLICSHTNIQFYTYIQTLFEFTRLEEKNIQASYESKLKRKNQLLASRSNKLKRFGDSVPDLLDSITEAHVSGRFVKKPVGPIGSCISLKDPTLAVAVECCLRSFMKAFCCDNYKDEAVLQELMSQHYPKSNRPQIIVCPFSEKVYNLHGRKVCHPEFPSVMDVIISTSPVIMNCLIDMRGIESILIIKEKAKARRFMQRGRPPKNCREAFTVEGDQVYPNRYYTSDFSMEYVVKATKISPERLHVPGSTKSIDAEITRLKKKIKVYESSHGEQEQYAEALALYREKTNQVRDLQRFIDQLDNIMSDRQNRYKILRRSLSVRCKLYFNNFLIKLNCCGSMIFDHNNETLSILVKPPGWDDDGVSDMRSLSGGERSFSTVCFMLSLWEITESPFRCLDEFDVYMDMHNRRISLDLLLELSERQHFRQFIFITPLTTRCLRILLLNFNPLLKQNTSDG